MRLPLIFRVVKRLDAEPVAHQRQPAAVALDNGDGEHAVEALRRFLAPGMPGFKNDLGVAIGEETCSPCPQARIAAPCSYRCSR